MIPAFITLDSNSSAEEEGAIERVDGRVERFGSDGKRAALDDWDGNRGTNSKDVFL